MERLKTQCCIAGGGPAGMMLGYLLARQGVEVIVLEKHADFLRDFRGDTFHPSTLQIFHELGILDAFLKLPHHKTERISITISGESYQLADFSLLDVPAPYIAMMPQWDLLNFMAEKGRALPNFTLMQSTKATALLTTDGSVTGIIAESQDGALEITAGLSVACDGRDSTLRKLSGLKVNDLGAPIDVFWMRLPRAASFGDESMGTVTQHGFLVLINRGDYWQCALPFPKGSAETIRAQGLDAFKTRIALIEPRLAAVTNVLKSWDDVKLLNVQVNRMERWYKPGLLCIGDAAHAMSPVGGVGINLAVQDAVAAARILGPTFNNSMPSSADLKAVQTRRERAARWTQRAQIFAHNRVLIPVLTADAPMKAPLPLKLVNKLPKTQSLPARMVGIGVQPEHWPAGT